MRKIIIFILISFTTQSASAYEVEDYVSLLQWKSKWEQIIPRAVEGYIERGLSEYPANFSNQQVSEASDRIRNALTKKIDWSAMSDHVITGFRRECGDDLLDVMVEFYSGVEFTEEDKDFIANEYRSCGSASMQGAMKYLVIEIEDFIEEKEKILSGISEE